LGCDPTAGGDFARQEDVTEFGWTLGGGGGKVVIDVDRENLREEPPKDWTWDGARRRSALAQGRRTKRG
jgi:hypothetical protein